METQRNSIVVMQFRKSAATGENNEHVLSRSLLFVASAEHYHVSF
jgi:hypothetical protein